MPALFMGFVVTKWGIYSGKKKMALKFMILASLFLILLIFKLPVVLYVVCVFMCSILLGVTYPLTDAVYSDIISRMGKERKHLVGLCNSSTSLAYVIGPALAGLVASLVGEKLTFAVIGCLTLVVAIILFFTIPRKIHLPETEIKSWD
jgi:MFS family permease